MARRPKPAPGSNSSAVEMLRDFIDRRVALHEEEQELKDRKAELKAEIKARGFDLKAFEKVVKERLEGEDGRIRREETEAIADTYRAALGMLDGTPLGDAARKRLSDDPPDDPPPSDKTSDKMPDMVPGEAPGEMPPPVARPVITSEDIDEAREGGRQACRDGRKVIENPHVAGDPRRAAWDEGWCFEAGSDGMGIPRAFQRRSAKPGDKAQDEDNRQDKET